MNRKLLPCPFCGETDVDTYEGDGFVTYCVPCGAEAKSSHHMFQSVAMAEKHWNRRAIPSLDGLRALVEGWRQQAREIRAYAVDRYAKPWDDRADELETELRKIEGHAD